MGQLVTNKVQYTSLCSVTSISVQAQFEKIHRYVCVGVPRVVRSVAFNAEAEGAGPLRSKEHSACFSFQKSVANILRLPLN